MLYLLEDGQVIKVDGELGVIDDKESIFSTLKFRNCRLNPVGPIRKKASSKTRTILVTEDVKRLRLQGHPCFCRRCAFLDRRLY